MKISVSEQTQRFYLACEKWEPLVGHAIKVGKYMFCAIPLNNCINVSEITSGVKIFDVPNNFEVMLLTNSKEDTIKFFEKIGESIKSLIEKTSDFDDRLEKMKKTAFERLGEMPPIEEVDTDWIIADVSDVLN